MPATHFIDAMMQALGRRYYVSLVSAAELHGAVKPAPSEPFQVTVDRHVTNRDLGTTELWFYKSRHAVYDISVEQHEGPTGPVRLASLTAVDLVERANDCWGIDQVAALLDALSPFHVPRLAKIAGPRDTPRADSVTSSTASTPNSAWGPSERSSTSTAAPRQTSPQAEHDADGLTRTGMCGSTRRPPQSSDREAAGRVRLRSCGDRLDTQTRAKRYATYQFRRV